MKTIYSLQEFRNQLLEIAKLKNEDYVHVEVRADHTGAVTFNAYIHNCSWHRAETMEECLSHFRQQLTVPTIKNIDVEIDIDEKTEVPELVEEKTTTPTDDLPF